jgi:tetratricopeptide (TPR) repeat protein
MLRRLCSLALLCAVLAPSRATAIPEAQSKKARELYESGRVQYQAEHFQEAYDLFKQAYLLSPSAPLLYNMAASLQSLGRPHEAAEELRGYLRAAPDSPDRAKLESRILALEEAQRLLDRAKPAPVAEPTPHVAPTPVEAPAPLVVATPTAAPPPRHKQKTLIIALSSVGAVLVVGGLGLGLGLGLHDWHTTSTLGTKAGTP